MSTDFIPADLLGMISEQRTKPITPAIAGPVVPVDRGTYTTTSSAIDIEPELTVSAMVDQMIAAKAAIAEADAAFNAALRDHGLPPFNLKPLSPYQRQIVDALVVMNLNGEVVIPAPSPAAKMRDCVICTLPFYSRNAANVVCIVCKSESDAEFEGGL